MFDLPQAPTSADGEPDVIALDEEGEHVAKFLDYLSLPDWVPPVKLSGGIAETAAIVSIADKFGFREVVDPAEVRLQQLLAAKCWAVWREASRREDVQLGRRALLMYTPATFNGKPDLFWSRARGGRLEWQVELARCIMPVLVYGQSGGLDEDFRRTIKTASRMELNRAVARFNPA